MAVEPTNDWKVNELKYPKLRDHHLQVYQEGQAISAIHVSSGINVASDSRPSAKENWEVVQQALDQALEHQESIGPRQRDSQWGPE